MLRILIVCAIISIIFNEAFANNASDREIGKINIKTNIFLQIGWIEGFAIFCAVFVVSGVGSWNDYKKDEQFVELQKISARENNVIVKREGKE